MLSDASVSALQGSSNDPVKVSGSAACFTAIFKALRQAYSTENGYHCVYPAKLSQYRKKRYTETELPAQILREKQLPEKQRGKEADIMKLFARMYKKNGWDSYAKFETSRGGLNQPYVCII